MTDLVRRVSRVPAPRGLIGMLGMVLAVEMFLAHRPLDCADPLGMEWAWSARAARREAPRRQVLCFGDSLMKMGVLPRVVEETSGRTAYNLAVGGGLAPVSYFLLRRALAAGAKPDAVVVEYFPPLLRADPRHNLTQWPYLASLREALELALAARDPDLLTRIALGRALPSVRGRGIIRATFLAALAGQEGIGRRVLPECWRNWRRDAGAQLAPSRADAPLLPSSLQWATTNRFDRRPEHEAYIGRFLELAASRGIRVYWLVMPVSPAVQVECDRSGLSAEYARFLRSWQDRFPGLVIVDARRAGFGRELFFDPNHLGREGARALSVELGHVLAGVQADRAEAERWVSLPVVRDGLFQASNGDKRWGPRR